MKPTAPICLYCPNPAASQEHIFPASLGGLRPRRGILCGECNNTFGPLVEALVEEIGPLCGMLGVANTRTGTKAVTRLESDSGPLVFDERGRPALEKPQVVHEKLTETGTKEVLINFSSERQYQQWLESERRQGRSPKQLSRVEQVRYLTSPPRLKVSIGSEEARRAVAQVAYNVVAHISPSMARESGFQALRDYVRNGTDRVPRTVEFVSILPDQLQDPLFDFGHQIFVAQEGHAITGLVRLFGALDFIVRLGKSIGLWNDVVVDIDPLALRAPEDMHVREFAGKLSTLRKHVLPDEPKALVEPLRNLMERIGQRQWRLDTDPLLKDLNLLRANGRADDRRKVAGLLDDYSTRVRELALTLHKRVLVLAEKRTSESDDDRFVRSCLGAFVHMLEEADPRHPTGISLNARVALSYLMQQITEVIVEELSKGPIEQETLDSILRGAIGQRAVWHGILELGFQAGGLS